LGLHLSSSGQAWENAFSAAVEFLEKDSGLLLLGPGIGEAGKEWLQDHSLKKNPLRLGASVQDWKEWVKGRARSSALSQGRAFRVLNQASQREFFRQTLKVLSEGGVFQHIGEMWHEERFFVSLLDCVEEARLAGLHELGAIERAQGMLANGADAISREVYDDFWALLLAVEVRLGAEGDAHDWPSLLRLAASSEDSAAVVGREIFLLGFDALTILESDLVQRLAEGATVHLPVALPSAFLQDSLSAREVPLDHTAAVMVRGLVTGFSGEIELEGESVEGSPAPTCFLLEGHAPSEEIRAAAALGGELLRSGREVRFVLPPDALEEHQSIFREEMGLPKNFHARQTLAHPVARLFFHALALKDHNYDLAHSLEFAQLLQFTLGKFKELPTLATRLGVRAGLSDWQKKSAHPEMAEFTKLLESIEELIPTRALCVVYAQGLAKLAELCGIGELARRAVDRETEREAHAALSAVLRNAQMLAASVKEPLTFQEWMRELFALLSTAQAGDALSFSRVQFFRYGEWLPPESKGAVTMALRWDGNVGPKRAFSFYFEEGARRKLSDLQMPSQVQEELTFLDSMERIARSSTALFSWSRQDGAGNELEPSWLASALSLRPKTWPEVARRSLFQGDFQPVENVKTSAPNFSSLSASLLELYKECPFRAFALKVLRLEDKMQASSLDVGPMDLGSIVHRTLELYYGEHKGKGRPEGERLSLLEQSLQRAVGEQKIEYFKGGEALLAVQVNRLRQMLLDFLALDEENYQKFPLFGHPEVEVKVGGMIGPHKWKGKVDRIDVDETNRRLLVLDYKTGATTPASKELKELDRFQLQLYLDAAEAQHPGFEAVVGST